MIGFGKIEQPPLFIPFIKFIPNDLTSLRFRRSGKVLSEPRPSGSGYLRVPARTFFISTFTERSLADNRDKLEALAEALLEKETLDAAEIRELVGSPSGVTVYAVPADT